MNILVTGANGQLGNEMRIVSKKCVNNEFIFSDISYDDKLHTIHLDITNIDNIREIVKNYGIKCIINCAAWTNVDACEVDKEKAELAYKLNAEAPLYLAQVMKEVDGLLIHISTDYVFGMEKYNTPCKPNYSGTPTGVYGKTKLEGEENIKNIGCKYVIIRTSWLYSEFGKNFCKTMLKLTKEKEELNVVFDQCGTPTYAYDLANAIIQIIDVLDKNDYNEKYFGIYHFSNEGVTSWYDFTNMIAKISGHNKCKINPCFSDMYPSPVVRPSYSVLDKTLIKEVFNVDVPYWVDSLEKCIFNLKNFV